MQLHQMEQIHRSAQAQLGLIGGLLASAQFTAVDPASGNGVQGWARLVAAQALELRELSAALAITAYQLGRLIQTGRSLGEPLRGARTTREIGQSFIDLINVVADLPASRTDLGADLRSVNIRNTQQTTLALDTLREVANLLTTRDLPDIPAPVDTFNWPQFSTRVTGQLATLLANAAKNSHSAQSYVAGIADKAVLGAGRDIGLHAATADPTVLLWARGTSSSPCAFCAMLAANSFRKPNQHSKQWVIEHTNARTIPGAFDDLLVYIRSAHPNCKCYPIFRHIGSEEPLPERNDFYRQMWHQVTDGIQGNDQVSASRAMRRAYRRWITAHKERNAGSINTEDTSVTPQ